MFWILAMAVASPLWAAAPLPASADLPGATASSAARRSAILSIPFEALDAAGRAKVNSVLANITVFRRLPTRVVSCDPDLYLFLVRHPDVIVNVWQALGITQLQLRQMGPDLYRVVETEGASASLEFLYHGRDTHLLYAEWTYIGPLLARKINGRCLAVLKSGFVRQPDGRYYVTSRLDGFLSVEPGGVELLTKTLHPLVVKNTDSNFIQTVTFVGSLSRTAEVNPGGMQRLAARLTHVEPDVRQQLVQVVAGVAQRAAARTDQDDPPDGRQMAARPPDDGQR
ncbi:MAG: hypothetical protein ABSF26_16240 [Thermoguttaceae bacterium]